MKNYRLYILHLFSLFILFNSYASFVNSEHHFTFCYDPYPPYTLGQKGRPSGGIKVTLMENIFAKIGNIEIDIILLPWKQCQQQVKLGHLDGILPLFKNQERNEYMVFSKPVLQQASAFWYNKRHHQNEITWKKFSDLDTLKLGMLNGSYIDQEMENTFESKRGIHRAKNVNSLFQALEKGHIDLVAIDKQVGQYVVDKEGLQAHITVIEPVIGYQPSYIGLSKKSPIINYLSAINQAIDKLKLGKFD